MKRQAPTPFDPDALMQRGHAAERPVDEAGHLPAGVTMLSDLLKEHGAGAGPGMSTPLDNRRKYFLADLARRAWQAAVRSGKTTEREIDYRRRIAEESCGRRISLATVGDYKLIQAAFLRELGRLKAAAVAAARATTTALDIAHAKLVALCRERGYPESYAEGVARRIYKRSLGGLTNAKEVWTIIFTLTNNANARDGRGKQANRFKSLKSRRQKGGK